MGDLPLGVYFRPSDRDLIEHLRRKNTGQNSSMFVFTQPVKNENGKNVKRKAGNGSWIPRTAPKEILSQNSTLIGWRKYFVFKLSKLDVNSTGYWTMYEYMRENHGEDTYALCVVTVNSGKVTTEFEEQ